MSDEAWAKAFAHYFNLLCGMEFCRLAAWLQKHDAQANPNVRDAAIAFGLEGVHACDVLATCLTDSLTRLEVHVNNPTQVPPPIYSMAEAPVRLLAEAVSGTAPAVGKTIFVCIDEYENLLDSQQAIINTYIKHAAPPLSYKVGVKKGGLRSRATIDTSDVLVTPDDYLEIDISAEGFDVFAEEVVEIRLAKARSQGAEAPEILEEFLPELPFGREAVLLGCERVADGVLEELIASGDNELVRWARELPKSELFFVAFWAEAEKSTVPELARGWRADPMAWSTRLGNYGYASLFWLSKGRKGARIRKYYAGARTILSLASGNIRYFIELIDEAIRQSFADSSMEGRWSGSIDPEYQTVGARMVGRRRLEQLEGLSEHGAEIKRLVLALGKVFFEFARDPIGRSPECNSFVLTGSPDAQRKILALLHEGVADLAFEVTPRTKATTQREMRDDEFRLHPIFAPFFEFSHRRKRRLSLSAEALLDVLDNPSRALASLMGRGQTAIDELPSQLAMFSTFYESEGATE